MSTKKLLSIRQSSVKNRHLFKKEEQINNEAAWLRKQQMCLLSDKKQIFML